MAGTERGSRQVRDGMLTVRIKTEAGTEMLELAGELDMANAATFSAELERAETDAETITVDMSELEFIDSTGIAILVAAHRRANVDGERLRFVRSRAIAVQRVMDVTGLDRELPFTS